jgi:hypothetical protein
MSLSSERVAPINPEMSWFSLTGPELTRNNQYTAIHISNSFTGFAKIAHLSSIIMLIKILSGSLFFNLP